MARGLVAAVLASSAVALPVLLASERAQAGAEQWKVNAIWCSNNDDAPRERCLKDMPIALLPRSEMVRRAVELARKGRDEEAWRHLLACQCHNLSARATLEKHRDAALDWLKQGAPD